MVASDFNESFMLSKFAKLETPTTSISGRKVSLVQIHLVKLKTSRQQL